MADDLVKVAQSLATRWRELTHGKEEVDPMPKMLEIINKLIKHAKRQQAEIERLRAAQPHVATRTEFNRDGTLDEIVALGAFVHLEQMDSNQYWLMITAGDTDHVIWLTARGKIKVSHETRPAYVPTPPEPPK